MRKIIWLSALLIVLHSSCKEKQDNLFNKSNQQEQFVYVDTIHIAKTNFSKEYFSNGTIVPKKKFPIYNSVDGFIDKIFINPGDIVKMGDIICVLKNKQLEEELTLKEQEYNRSLIDLEDLLIGNNFKLADSTKIPKKIWETACSRSGYKAKQLELEMLRDQLQNLVIKAPFKGVITNIKVHIGQPVSSNSLICNLSDNNPVVVRFFLIEDEYFEIKKGQKVVVNPYVNHNSFIGKISSINPEINENGLFEVSAEIDNPDNLLIEGMNVKIKILGDSEKHIVIPKKALITRNNQNIVYTFYNGEAVWNFVEIYGENSDCIAISKGLREGDAIIINENLFLNINTPVRIK